MKVALVPMRVKVGDFPSNKKEFERSLRGVMGYRPDLVLFPEYFLTGFKPWDFSPARIYGEILNLLKDTAVSFGVYLAAGLLETSGSCVYNSAVLVSPDGSVILKHRKFQEPMRFCRGEELEAAETRWGKLSIIICGDLYNDRVLERIKEARPDYLLVPMEYAPPYGPLSGEDVEAMSQRVRLFGSATLVVNSFPPGGAWVFNRRGELIFSSRANEPLIANV